MEQVKTERIELGRIVCNDGRIEGLPKNPRVLDTDSLEKLKKSLTEHGEMLELRELLVYEYESEYVVIGGNMRLRAMRELGFKNAPCKIIPKETPIETLKAYLIKDNVTFGEWDSESLRSWDESEVDDVTEEDKPWEDERENIAFTLSSEQMKFVKQKLNKLNKEDNADALIQYIEQYGRA